MEYRPVWQEGDPQPTCICGCGRPVRLARTSDRKKGLKEGQPYNYANDCPEKCKERNTAEAIKMLNAVRLQDAVPVEPFKVEVLRLKMEKGLTWGQIHRMTGRFVRSAVQNSQQLVSRELVNDVLPVLREASPPMSQMIPVSEFRQVIRKVKDRKGLSWTEIRLMTGHDVKSVCFPGRAQKNVSRAFATTVLKRLAGIGTPPTPIEQKRIQESIRRDRKWLQEYQEERRVG